MPIYDYHCETCGLDFELEQSFSEDTLRRCPTKKSGRSPEGCASSGRGRVIKVFSAPGITFKGAGFYKTDSRNGSGRKSSSTTSSGDAGSSSEGSAAKSDTAKSDSAKSDTAKSTSTTSSTSE